MYRTILALALVGTAMPALAQTTLPAPPPGAPMAPPPGGPMRAGMLMRADANGDGVVTRAEAIAAADARFDRLDADHDGIVTRDEMRAAREAMRGGPDGAPPPSADGARRDVPPPPPPGAGEKGRGMTRDESRARALEAFDRADANHDGTIDAGEMAQLRAMRPGSRPNRGGDMPPPPPRN